MILNLNIVSLHQQLFNYSCIPMAAEFVLKLNGKLPPNNFDLQNNWGNKNNGNFADFDNQTFYGLQFHRQYANPRGVGFPLNQLFQTIQSELAKDRYVVISLEVPGGWHNYVIYDQLPNGEFAAITKGRDPNNEINNVREIVNNMNGTDILTYTIPK